MTVEAAPVELTVGPPAHGGHCVARHDGRVVFVRHALPGERVRARLTDARPGARFWRADAVEVLEASTDRVEQVWPEAGPGGVGGGELGHVALPAQRRWKSAVVGEQLRRVGGLDVADVPVHGCPSDTDGRGWRTRIELVADAEGRAGMHRHRSSEVVPLTTMPLAVPWMDVEGLLARRWPPGGRLSVVAPEHDRRVVLVDGVPWGERGPDTRTNARTSVREQVTVAGTEHTWRVGAAGFWQVHRDAPAVLAEAVLAALEGLGGMTLVDLYSGAGMLTRPMAVLAGAEGRVHAVEGDRRAVRDARRNLHDAQGVTLHHGPVAEVLDSGAVPSADAVVLDPPRVGAGRRVVEQVVALAPGRVVYVACDPAALARDLGYLADHGYRGAQVTAFDLFPATHHVECVAVVDRA
ncbi:class I SAM-dependent RNA methyltransferase [Cellulomonas bogoriensis]|uniref:SAM-dependent methyltransferase n=1 Tax=Cellulomonas bogoriensis 69B4 = DSM 16987 TaxID=1386082 RepID=A0A0A0C4M5_9CELL|nr:TRAM domain-containing protein [Cellulomonas bogoriensis]KGM14289.1 SAM-dependent methyltransferase [Cellulomonas bogoriensis 69B4 = DSM 16987]